MCLKNNFKDNWLIEDNLNVRGILLPSPRTRDWAVLQAAVEDTVGGAGSGSAFLARHLYIGCRKTFWYARHFQYSLRGDVPFLPRPVEHVLRNEYPNANMKVIGYSFLKVFGIHKAYSVQQEHPPTALFSRVSLFQIFSRASLVASLLCRIQRHPPAVQCWLIGR